MYLNTIPEPFSFNIWKHHLGEIRRVLDSDPSRESVLSETRTIGNGVLDLYTGGLGALEITGEMHGSLLETIKIATQGNEADGSETMDRPDRDLPDPRTYAEWIEGNGGYRTMEISDGSTWVLRWGRIRERFIHIHPGRKSMHTVRFNASAWKSAVLLYYLKRHCEFDINKTIHTIDIDSINRARGLAKDLPPLDESTDASAIRRAWRLLCEGL